MMKALKTITFTLLISSVLSFNGFALPNDNGQKQKDKPPERPKEQPKGGEDRGGKGDKPKPKDKKPDGEFFS
ncbi:MAG: hypothetical protein AB7U82_00625 [Blastocatellales bacterium]